MEEKELTQQESLQIIESMIKQTRKNVSEGAGNLYLIWGYLTIANIIGVIVAESFLGTGSCSYWYLASPVVAGIWHYLYLRNNRRGLPHVKTYMEEVSEKVWKGLSYGILSYLIYAVMYGDAAAGFLIWHSYLCFFVALTGLGSYIMGTLLKIKRMSRYASFGSVLGICDLVHLFSDNLFRTEALAAESSFSPARPILMIFGIILTLIIPSYILNQKAKE